jgi:DNA-binding beta-propeller fold protein YncE
LQSTLATKNCSRSINSPRSAKIPATSPSTAPANTFSLPTTAPEISQSFRFSRTANSASTPRSCKTSAPSAPTKNARKARALIGSKPLPTTTFCWSPISVWTKCCSTVSTPPRAQLKPGAGPRHIAFHPNGKFVFVAGEVDSTVTSFSFDANKGTLKQIGTLSTLPACYSGRNDVAEIAIHPNGKFLYVSNRGHDSIAVFAIQPGKGTLTLVAHVPTGGKEPRHFAIDPNGKFLLAENQLSDNIAEFHIDPRTGKLTPTSEVISVPSPVCLQFVPIP